MITYENIQGESVSLQVKVAHKYIKRIDSI